MTGTAVEKVISEIEQLNPEEQQEIFQQLEKRLNGANGSSPAAQPVTNKPESAPTGSAARGNPLHRDRSREFAWLEQHRAEYIGQWVALEGDQLLHHTPSLKELFAVANRGDFRDALMVLIETTEGPDYHQTGKGDRTVAINWPRKDRSPEHAWLEQHRHEYSGEWLALDGDRLVSHSPILREVTAETKKQGVHSPYLIRIDSPDDLPWAGF
ncbi:MAG: hypothetical protein ABI977_20980 [Acidobacteriota bacterium]